MNDPSQMQPSEIDVSVIIAAWGAASTLEQSVTSALEQTGVSVEVVIVDDASSDNTYATGKDLARTDPRLRVFRNAVNGGPGAARNTALNHARGKWVAVLDADDRMEPCRLAGMVAMAQNEGADVVLGNVREVDEDGTLAQRRFVSDPTEPGPLSAEMFVRGNLAAMGARTLGYLKPLLRKSFLDAHNIRYNPQLRNGEDYHFIMACYVAGARVWFSPEASYLYTRRSGSVSYRADLDHLAALLRADIELAKRHGQSPSLEPLVQLRRRETEDLLVTETAMRALKSRRFGAALDALIRRPTAIRSLSTKLIEALRKRL